MSALLILFWIIYNNFLFPSCINNLKSFFAVCSFNIWMRITTLFLLKTNYLHPWLSLVSNCPIKRVIPDPPTSSFLPSIMGSRHSAVKLLSLGRRTRWSRESAVLSRSVLSDSLWPHRLQPGSSVHGDSPGKNTGVGCHALLQGIFPTQESNPDLLPWRQILYCLSHQRSPSLSKLRGIVMEREAWHALSFFNFHGVEESDKT